MNSFDWIDHAPAQADQAMWDAVVVGAGMGGSFLGCALAQRGLKVLFLERGPASPPPASSRSGRFMRLFSESEKEAELARRSNWPKRVKTVIDGRARHIHFPLGNGPGGSSAIYGAALERFQRLDFTGANGAPAAASVLPNAWPIPYDAFLPFYRKAEEMLRVHGARDANDPDDDADLRPPPPLSERDQYFFEQFETAGLKPYRLHVGIDYQPGCVECLGVICPRSCKSDGASRALRPAVEQFGAKLMTGFEAERFLVEGERVTAVQGKVGGHPIQIRARLFALAAGALASPLLLLRSRDADWPNGLGNRNDLVGRGLMFHLFQSVAVRAPADRSRVGPGKSLASRAFYVRNGRRLGSLQSFSAQVERGHIAQHIENLIGGAAAVLGPSSRIVSLASAAVIRRYFEGAGIFATQTEDYAFHENRVLLDPDSASGYAIHYRLPEDLKARALLLREELRNALARCRPIFLTNATGLNFGHPAGTCRVGASPEDSVLDETNKLRGVDNLYVVDASFLPTISAVNPSLTVAANALRVADLIARTGSSAPAFAGENRT